MSHCDRMSPPVGGGGGGGGGNALYSCYQGSPRRDSIKGEATTKALLRKTSLNEALW